MMMMREGLEVGGVAGEGRGEGEVGEVVVQAELEVRLGEVKRVEEVMIGAEREVIEGEVVGLLAEEEDGNKTYIVEGHCS